MFSLQIQSKNNHEYLYFVIYSQKRIQLNISLGNVSSLSPEIQSIIHNKKIKKEDYRINIEVTNSSYHIIIRNASNAIIYVKSFSLSEKYCEILKKYTIHPYNYDDNSLYDIKEPDDTDQINSNTTNGYDDQNFNYSDKIDIGEENIINCEYDQYLNDELDEIDDNQIYEDCNIECNTDGVKYLKIENEEILVINNNTQSNVKTFGSMWLIWQIEQKVKCVEMIDSAVEKRFRRETLSSGMYFFLAAANRLIEPRSKNKLSEWYSQVDVSYIFNEDKHIKQLNSSSYYYHWRNINPDIIIALVDLLLQRCAIIACVDPNSKFLSYDTTNFYTYICYTTKSELAARGKNKQGRDSLRQIGLSLLVDNQSKQILYANIYRGNIHDSKVFLNDFEPMMQQIEKCGKKEIFFMFDKGINSDEGFQKIDSIENVHFITSYSPKKSQRLCDISLNSYEVIDCGYNRGIDEQINKYSEDPVKNKDLIEKLKNDKVIAYSSKGVYWGKLRKVVIVFNPKNARKKEYLFNEHMMKIKEALDEIKHDLKNGSKAYKTKSDILKKYSQICAKYHISTNAFELTITTDPYLKLSYTKKRAFIDDEKVTFGKTILICDVLDLPTSTIVQQFFDKYVVEYKFRNSKDPDCCCFWPINHWTDRMLYCHYFSCLISLSYLDLIGYFLRKNGIDITPQHAIDIMNNIHCSVIKGDGIDGNEKIIRLISTPTPLQEKILGIFGYKIIGTYIVKI